MKPSGIKVGNRFMATVLKSDRSQYVIGQREGAGKVIGPFIATKIGNMYVEMFGRQFWSTRFDFTKVKV